MKTKRTSQYANELVDVYLYRMRISRVRACTCILQLVRCSTSWGEPEREVPIQVAQAGR